MSQENEPTEVDKALQSVEESIRAGRFRAAQHNLKELLRTKPPRKNLALAANLARRCGLPFEALKLLARIVRPGPRSQLEASASERSEYASALLTVGASREALSLLEKVSARDYPQALLYKAFAHVTQWEYEESIPVLREFLALGEGVTPYQKIVGQVNLISALVFERHHREAESLLDQLLKQTKTEKNRLLEANLLELATYNALFQDDPRRARAHIEQAQALVDSPDSLAQLLVEKASLLAALHENPQNKGAYKKLHLIREKAWSLQHWETARDCDYYLARFGKQDELFQRLYFGTPFESFRRRLRDDYVRIFPQGRLPCPSYSWNLSLHTPRAGEKRLEVKTGKYSASRDSYLEPGQVLQRFLEIFCSDFYRPLSLPYLYSELFPDSYFNPQSSPVLVRQHLRRLRMWMREHRVPLEIHFAAGSYRLRARKGAHCTLVLESADYKALRAPGSLSDRLLRALKKRFGAKAFSISEATSALDQPKRTVLRQIRDLVDADCVKTLGQGKSTKYQCREL